MLGTNDSLWICGGEHEVSIQWPGFVECDCGWRKRPGEDWKNRQDFSGNFDKEAYEMLQTEGHGYGSDTSDPLDSHHPNNQD